MNKTVKQNGIVRLKEAIENIEDKLSKSKIINVDSGLSDSATRIDTEILKALKTENAMLKNQQQEAKQQIDSLIKELKSKIQGKTDDKKRFGKNRQKKLHGKR